MVSQEELSEMQLIQEVTSKAGTVEAKIEKATQQRQVEVDALEKRVTANEDSIVKIKEDIELAHEDVDEMMQILKEVNAAQQEIADGAVNKVLENVAVMVQKTTKEAAKDQMEKAKEDAEIMVGTIQKNSQKLEEKLSKETKAREKQDNEIAALQSKVSELMVQLEQKTSEETTNEVESMVSVIQEKIRKEKTERFRSEKEITLMREEMAKMQTEIR